MKVRYRKYNKVYNANRFNINSTNEILVGDDSLFITDLDVWLDSQGRWMDMGMAFNTHNLVTDNFNTYFFEPRDQAEKERGYAL